MYNVSPKDIASYNNLQFENGLSVGESLKIPLNSNNFSQSTSVTGAETLIPVYHHVQPKEGLYRVSVNYNKVPLNTIKQWNHLSSDEVTIGTSLIVGYLKVNKDESKLASGSLASDEPVVSNNNQSKPKPTPPIINEEKLPPAQSQAEQKRKQIGAQELAGRERTRGDDNRGRARTGDQGVSRAALHRAGLLIRAISSSLNIEAGVC